MHRLFRPRSTPLARGAPEVWHDSRHIERATLHASGATHIARRNWSYRIDFNHPDFRAIQTTLSRIGKEKYEEQQNAVHAHLKGLFPNQFSGPPDSTSSRTPCMARNSSTSARSGSA